LISVIHYFGYGSFIGMTNIVRERLNDIISCLYRFQFLFWCLKLKKQFRDWLWLKVRLPKIEKTYHPTKLNELLFEKDDIDEEELDNIITNW
jgi:hypothetical protein